MSVEVGQVLKGKVTGIQNFGAFVQLEGENTQGLVHISEVSNTFVKDINEYLQVGQEVDVKVIKVDENNKKISLSIRALMPNPDGNKGQKREKSGDGAKRERRGGRDGKRGANRNQPSVSYKDPDGEAGYTLLADKLKGLNL